MVVGVNASSCDLVTRASYDRPAAANNSLAAGCDSRPSTSGLLATADPTAAWSISFTDPEYSASITSHGGEGELWMIRTAAAPRRAPSAYLYGLVP